MAQHVFLGTGLPDSLVAPRGAHYIDQATGKQYLQSGGDAFNPVWSEFGAAGGGAAAMSVLTQDASVSDTLALDFTHSDVLIYNNPASGNINLGMGTIDSAVAGKVDVAVLSFSTVTLNGGYGGAFISPHDGITFAAGVFTLPAGALGMALSFKSLGVYPAHGGNALIIEARALTAQSSFNA